MSSEQPQKPGNLCEPPGVAEIAQVPIERRLEVAGKPSFATAPGTCPSLWVAAGGHDGDEGVTSNQSRDTGRRRGEQRVDEVLTRAVNLALRQGPQADRLDPPGIHTTRGALAPSRTSCK